MAESIEKVERAADIAYFRAEADRIYNAVKHPPMKLQVTLALFDLAEAEKWLESKNIEKRPAILSIVDLAIGFAESRLKMVSDAFDQYGPDATMVG